MGWVDGSELQAPDPKLGHHTHVIQVVALPRADLCRRDFHFRPSPSLHAALALDVLDHHASSRRKWIAPIPGSFKLLRSCKRGRACHPEAKEKAGSQMSLESRGVSPCHDPPPSLADAHGVLAHARAASGSFPPAAPASDSNSSPRGSSNLPSFARRVFGSRCCRRRSGCAELHPRRSRCRGHESCAPQNPPYHPEC